ncbi:hypothetical protein AMTRI_Chr13g121180 [Amborella trichopoda]
MTPASLLQPLPIPNLIWDDISIDFIDGLLASKGKTTILVVVDWLSKYAHLTTISHPYTADWSKSLSWAEYCYNTNWHSTIKTIPFEAVYGKAPPTLLSYDEGTSRTGLLNNLEKNIKEAQKRMKRVYDSKHNEREFLAGDWLSMAIRRDLKLSPKFFGPFQILKQIGAVACKLDLPSDSKIRVVFHVSLLKPKLRVNDGVQTQLSVMWEEDGIMSPKPQAILNRCVRKNKEEVLILWYGLPPSDAAWEPVETIRNQFPDHTIEDKGII